MVDVHCVCVNLAILGPIGAESGVNLKIGRSIRVLFVASFAFAIKGRRS